MSTRERCLCCRTGKRVPEPMCQCFRRHFWLKPSSIPGHRSREALLASHEELCLFQCRHQLQSYSSAVTRLHAHGEHGAGGVFAAIAAG